MPTAVPGTVPGGVPTPTPPKTSSFSTENSGVLTVSVPYDAKVTVNGRLTKATGSRRQFISFGLQPGLSYKYVVKAEVVRDGQTVEDTRTVSLTAGQIESVAFGFNLTPPEQVAASK
ncbi:MAG: TIGR03000 domain-containing protein [Thermoguttaceae bacterium]